MGAAHARMQLLALGIAEDRGYVTSPLLAAAACVSLATASARLTYYAGTGALERIDESHRSPREPYRYALSDAGREWLQRGASQRRPEPDFAPLLAAWGYAA